MQKRTTAHTAGILLVSVLLAGACGSDDDTSAATTTAPTTTAATGEAARVDPCELATPEMVTEVTGEEVTDTSWLSSGGIYDGVAIGAEICRFEYGEPVRDDAGEMIEELFEISVGLVLDETGEPNLSAIEELAAVAGDDEEAAAASWPSEATDLGDEAVVADDALIVRSGNTALRFGYGEDSFSDDSPISIGADELDDLVAFAGEVTDQPDLIDGSCSGLLRIAEDFFDDAVEAWPSAGGGTRTVDGEQIDYDTATCRVELAGTSTEVEVTVSEDEGAFEALSVDPLILMGTSTVEGLGDAAYRTGGHLFVLDGDRVLKFGDSNMSTVTDEQLVEFAELVIDR